MMALQRPGRTAAVVGAVVAVSATTLMGFAGTALARVPGTCTETVNVRAEPSIDSRIVAVCEAGTAVETGATRDGFVRIVDLGGWASAQYISVDAAEPSSTGAPSATSPSTGTAPTTRPSSRPAPADEDESTGTGSGDELSQEPAGREPATTGRDATGSGTGEQSPGRSSFTPEDSAPPTGPADDDAADDSGLGGGLL